MQCAKMLVNLGGVQVVYWANDYRIRDSLDLLRRASIHTTQLSIETPK